MENPPTPPPTRPAPPLTKRQQKEQEAERIRITKAKMQLQREQFDRATRAREVQALEAIAQNTATIAEVLYVLHEDKVLEWRRVQDEKEAPATIQGEEVAGLPDVPLPSLSGNGSPAMVMDFTSNGAGDTLTVKEPT